MRKWHKNRKPVISNLCHTSIIAINFFVYHLNSGFVCACMCESSSHFTLFFVHLHFDFLNFHFLFLFFSATTSENFNRSPVPQRLFSMQNTSDDSVNVTLVSSPTKKKRDLTATATATPKASSVIPFVSAGAAIPNDAITKDETVETDERSSNTSQAIKSNSKTRSSKSFFKRKDKTAKQRNSANNTNKNTEAHGFISSFNQITSNNLPVITSATTTMLRNAVSGGGSGSGSNRKGERNSGMDHYATEFIDDFTNDYSMEQILNKKSAKDESNKYSKTHFYASIAIDKFCIKFGKFL